MPSSSLGVFSEAEQVVPCKATVFQTFESSPSYVTVLQRSKQSPDMITILSNVVVS